MAGTVTITTALKGLAAIVGADSLSEAPELLREYAGGAGAGPRGNPVCVVRPHGTEQVRAVVKLANEQGLNLVPVSSGAPHLRGATVPGGEGVILDLSAMDRIVRLDKLNRVAIIEPGVTFAQLKKAAEAEELKVFMPLYPRAAKSVLAACLEREPVTTAKYHWDMPDPLLCTEMVFGSGDLFRTGSAAGPGSLMQQWEQGLAQRNPMGPANTDFARVVQGSQGTMAVVTWASVKLGALPRRRNLHSIGENSLQKLIDFSYRMFRVKYADEFLILNRFALGAMLAGDPDGAKAVAARQADYVLIYTVAGYRRMADERMSYQENGITAIAQQYGVVPAHGLPGVDEARILELLDGPCPEPYWKTRLKGGLREIFFLTTLDRTPAFIALMEELAARHAYPLDEVGIYIQPIQQGHTCHLEFDLFYDPANAAEAQAVEELFLEAGAAMSEAGGFFSRPYGPWAATAYARCPDTVSALRNVKEMLDPRGVMNRGKLCFGGE